MSRSHRNNRDVFSCSRRSLRNLWSSCVAILSPFFQAPFRLSDMLLRWSVAFFQIAKSFAFFAWSGNRSKCGIITCDKSFSDPTDQRDAGLQDAFRQYLVSAPHPTRLRSASSIGNSSARKPMAKTDSHRNRLLPSTLSPIFKLKLKHPSPSTNPVKYHPNASSESASIECASLMAMLRNSVVMGGANGLQPARFVILLASQSQERGAV